MSFLLRENFPHSGKLRTFKHEKFSLLVTNDGNAEENKSLMAGINYEFSGIGRWGRESNNGLLQLRGINQGGGGGKRLRVPRNNKVCKGF